MGIFFRAKREQLLDTESQKKRNLCRWVRSGLIAWKNGRYERFAVSRPRLFSTAGRSTMLFRARDAFPSISPRRIVIYGTLIPPRKEQSSSPDAISPFTYTSTRHVFVSLFCCFDALCNRDEWFEIEDGFEIAVTRCWNARICIYDNEIVCTLFCIECGKCGFYSCISRLLLAESWRMIRVYFPQSEIYLSSFLSCKIVKID